MFKNIIQFSLPYAVFTIAAAFLFFEMGLQVSPSVMVQDLMHDIGMDAASLGIMASVYYYSYTLMQIPAGILFDHLSSRYLITLSLAACSIGALLFGISHTVFLAGMGRFLTGLGSAFGFISVLFVAAQWFPAERFALLTGVAQFLAAIGAIGGEIPLATAVSVIGWRETMLLIAVMGASLALVAWLVIRDYPHSKPPLLVKVWPMVKQHLGHVIRHFQTWVVAFYSFAVWTPITTFAALWGVPYIVTCFGLTKTMAASACAMIWVGIGLGSISIGWWSERIGKRRAPLAWCAFLGLIVTIAILYLSNISIVWMFILMFLFGVSSSGQALSFAVVKDNNRSSVTGTAIGFNNMAVVSGGALFQPLVGMLLSYHANGQMLNGAPVYQASDYRYALIVLPICYLLGLFSLCFVRETNCRSQYLVSKNTILDYSDILNKNPT